MMTTGLYLLKIVNNDTRCNENTKYCIIFNKHGFLIAVRKLIRKFSGNHCDHDTSWNVKINK